MTTSAGPVPGSTRAGRRWSAMAAEHARALDRYLDTARALPDSAWEQPWAPGKWTPAQITEHLALGYDALIREAVEGVPMRARLPAWRRTLLRWVLLPHILFHRKFPLKAPAPREVRPAQPRAPRAEALEGLEALGRRFEAELAAAEARGVTALHHPYFGGVRLVRGLRFVAIHIEHHTRQIAHLR